MKKHIAIILCVALAISLWGCGSKQAERKFNTELLDIPYLESYVEGVNWAKDSKSFKVTEIDDLNFQIKIDDGYWSGTMVHWPSASNLDHINGFYVSLWHESRNASKCNEEYLEILEELTAICGKPIEERSNDYSVYSAFNYNGTVIKVAKGAVDDTVILLKIANVTNNKYIHTM